MDIYNKLKELFRKHLICPKDDFTFENHFYHNLEYLDWDWISGNQITLRSSTSSKRPFYLLDCFYGQDDKLSEIRQEFEQYLCNLKYELIGKILNGVNSLKKQNLPVGRIVLPEKWKQLKLGHCLFGISIDYWREDTIRVESTPEFGRFSTI